MRRANCAILFVVAILLVFCRAQLVSVDDTDPRVKYYSPNGTWTVHTGLASNWSLYDNSDTFIGVQGATATFANFPGSLIQYWGNQGPSHGSCNITIDGLFVGVISSYNAQNSAPILLFQKTDLDARINHTIVVTVANASGSNTCEVDRFVYSSLLPTSTSSLALATSPTSTNSPVIVNEAPSQENTNTSSTKKADAVAIGIGVAVGVVLSCIGIATWIYCWRKRRKRSAIAAAAAQPEEETRVAGPGPRMAAGPLPTITRTVPSVSIQSPISPGTEPTEPTDPGHDYLTTHSDARPISWLGDLSPATQVSSISSYSQTTERVESAFHHKTPHIGAPEPLPKPLPPIPISTSRPVTGRAHSHITSLPSQYSGETAVTGATPGRILSDFDLYRDSDAPSGRYRFTSSEPTESPPPLPISPNDAIFGSTSRSNTRGSRRALGQESTGKVGDVPDDPKGT